METDYIWLSLNYLEEQPILSAHWLTFEASFVSYKDLRHFLYDWNHIFIFLFLFPSAVDD